MADSDDSTVEYSEIEQQAMAQGWDPEYQGKNRRTAEEFLEFGKDLAPVLKRQRDEIRAENEALKQQLTSIRGTVEQLVKSRTEQLEQEHKSQVAWLKGQIREAKKSGDEDVVEQLQEQLEETQNNKPKPVTPAQAAGPSPQFLSWKARNDDWFEKDQDRTALAVTIANQIAQNNPALHKSPQFYDELDKRLDRMLGKPKSRGLPAGFGADAGGSTGGEGNRGSKGYASLPRDAKIAAQRFVQDFPGKTKEDYAKLYYGDE